jgi:uncharacterized Ntn-hydrolase superfamily protein
MKSKREATAIALAIPVMAAIAGSALSQERLQLPPRRPASYAILARDPITGDYGVAAASHAPLIGMNLEFLDKDAGGVVVLGGPFLETNEKILLALREGLTPAKAIPVGLYTDPDQEQRQVLAISTQGTAAFTGKKLAKQAADKVGEFYVVAGHRLENKDVIPAMGEAFLALDGPLPDRLIAALQAGRDAGGEKDGVRSAAILIVGPGARFATRDRKMDFRIDFVSGDAVAALTQLRAQVDSVYQVN